MGDSHNFAALDWVLGEIEETLKQARQSLEAYVENPDDSTRIRFCLTHIHQVHGSLQMVEFYGAALMAEEMEALAQAMIDGKINNTDEAQEVLMRAILQFPLYLDQVKLQRKDNPIAVLPLLNDLRAVRGESLLTQTKLFTPNLSPAQRVVGDMLPMAQNNIQFLAAVKKLRQMYQFAAASAIRGVNREESLEYLHKVFARLYKLTQGTARRPLWEIALALVEGLQLDVIESSVSVKNLLRQLDKEIRVLTTHGTKALNAFTSNDLIKNLLYYIAKTGQEIELDKNTPYLRRIYKMYHLQDALPDASDIGANGDNLLSGPDPETIRSVVAALQDELDEVKHTLDVCLSGQDDNVAPSDAIPVLQRVADTMAVLGVGQVRKDVLDKLDILQHLDGSDNPQDAMMSVASGIIFIENTLQSLAAGASLNSDAADTVGLQVSEAQASVLRECRSGLEQIKDSIVEYIASQWQQEHLENVPKSLREIRGGLEMIPLLRPAKILGACARYIDEQLLQQQVTPDWSTLDTLADAITSVEYYLERLVGDMQEDDDLLLTVAEESVSALGYAVAPASASASSQNADADSSAFEQTDTTAIDRHASADVESVTGKLSDLEQVDFDSTPLPEDVPADDTDVPESTSVIEPEPEAEPEEQTQQESFSQDSLGERQEDQAAHDEPDTQTPVVDEPSEAAEVTQEPSLDAEVDGNSAATVIAGTDAEQETGDSDDDLDDEIFEIFVEEAEEVTETIAEFFPQWATDFDNQEALTEFRRAFHTLKGSGRMVGADDIGELAWSIENMLNRIIDGSVKPGAPHVAIIEKVRGIVPALINAFRDKQPNPEAEKSAEYMHIANELSKGNVPENLPEELLADAEDASADNTLADDQPHLESADHSQNSTADTLEDKQYLTPEATADATESEHVSVENDNTDDVANGDIGHSGEDDSQVCITAGRSDYSSDSADSGSEDDDQLWEIFGAEALTHLQVVEDFIAEMEEAAPLYTPPSDATQRALHTLKGSAHMADISKVAELATPLEQFVKELRTYQVNIDDDILQLLRDAVAYTQGALHNLAQGETITIDKLPLFLARVAELREKFVAPLVRQKEIEEASKTVDPELLSIFMAEEMNLLLDADSILLNWQAQQLPTYQLNPLHRELATLHTGAKHANLPEMASLSGLLHSVYQRLLDDEIDAEDDLIQHLVDGHNALLDMVDAVAAGQNIQPANRHTLAALEALLLTPAIDADDDVADNSVDRQAESSDEHLAAENPTEQEFDTDITANTAAEIQFDDSLNTAPSSVPEEINTSADFEPKVADSSPTGSSLINTDEDDDEVDPEIVEIFIEEAEEMLEVIEEAVTDWEGDPENSAPIDELKRALHTYKGSARMAGLMPLGELAHEFETMLIDNEQNPYLDSALLKQVNHFQDQLLAGTEQVKAQFNGDVTAPDSSFSPANVPTEEPASASDTANTNASITDGNTDSSRDNTIDSSHASPNAAAPHGVNTDAGEAKDPTSSSASILPFTKPNQNANQSAAPDFVPLAERGEQSGGGNSVAAAQQQLAAKRSGPQEVVKISADLLEELVNLAGETSISRGRMEEQVGDLGMSLGEMDATIQRLQEQLRRLDIETEAQVLFRQEQMQENDEFDPLEMDRYSQLQQLSRSLIESASDLMDLKSTLNDKNRDTETLLLQQSRINTDLQEGLMRSRMVPFSRLVPRLRRIVRQVSSEVKKNVSFDLENVEGELDRTVLERMVAPLEHMLRNAVDHGIETPEQRAAAGKPEQGRILLTLAREGGDVLIKLIDDGAGINIARVREKAIERGLMDAEAKLNEQEIMQFILHAGFTTADQVTQISGRGVGMDVVHSEIKQMGGAMFINSRQGEGTEFIVRLPFTVSVNRALMVQIGDDRYAIPLNTIEGIVRVSPFELEHYYQDSQAHFEYAGDEYQIRYLGAMLNRNLRPKLEDQMMPLPVVLVRSTDHTVALQVDRLMGSREIVVKTLGPQFASVQELSGATVMGDGSVVVILDLNAMIRKEMAHKNSHIQLLEPAGSAINDDEIDTQTVMVVDDSVTVRKVTSRFLEREGYHVITAKDGREAMETLQDHIPDVMLLDIEMPRMDGFEVAKNIRSSSRLKDLPIIMITSRTGDKHRERALSLGVNKYMGKPYQEELLLSTIKELAEEKSQ